MDTLTPTPIFAANATRCRGTGCRAVATIDVIYNDTPYRSSDLIYIPTCAVHVGPAIVMLLAQPKIIEAVITRVPRKARAA